MYLPIFKANHVYTKQDVSNEKEQGDKVKPTYAKHGYHKVSHEKPDGKIKMSEVEHPYDH